MALWCWPLMDFSSVKFHIPSLLTPLLSLCSLLSFLSSLWNLGQDKKSRLQILPNFLCLTPNLWLLKTSRAKILTPLFSGYILTTSPKAMGDSCLASWLGKEKFSGKTCIILVFHWHVLCLLFYSLSNRLIIRKGKNTLSITIGK